MSTWNPELYLKFRQQRTQPSIDLANRVKKYAPKTAIDIGCGPGNSTAVLRGAFPEARIMGIDSSTEMIAQAWKNYPDMAFTVADAREIPGQYDLLFSNACLQWIPDHETLIPGLMEHVAPGGCLAVQMPMNLDEPFYRVIDEVSRERDWGFDGSEQEHNTTLTPEEYYDILAGCTKSFDAWETVYYHRMPDCESMIEWVRSARLRPYLNALTPEAGEAFTARILKETNKLYRPMADGNVLFRFRRFFFIGER